MPYSVRPANLCGWLFAALTCVFVAGCGTNQADQGIRTYRVAWPEDKQPDGPAEPGKPAEDKIRFLGAIIPATADESYFVRFMGPIDQIDPHVEAFDTFLKSIRVPGENGKPISWQIPEGWKDINKNEVTLMGVTVKRMVTIQKADGNSPELYISDLSGGDLLTNVNRWREQFVGIDRVTQAELPEVAPEITLGENTKAYRVDFRGPGPQGAGMRGPFMGGQ